MALWRKDTTSRAPLTVYHRDVVGEDGLVRLVYNPAGVGSVGAVYNVIGDSEPVTVEVIELLLVASGGLDAG